MDAKEYYRLARNALDDPGKCTAAGNELIRRLFEKTIELDENFSRAYAHFAYVYVREFQHGWSKDRTASLKKAEELSKKALSLVDDFHGHFNLASVYWNQGDFEKAFSEYEAARKHRPNDLSLDVDLGEALTYGGEPERAIELIEQAMRRKIPYCYWWNLARAYYMAERYQDALDTISKMPDPPNEVRLIAAASKAQIGDLDGAKLEMAEFSKNEPDWAIKDSANCAYRFDSDRQHWLDGLRKAGLKEE